jgi:threonine aldolase
MTYEPARFDSPVPIRVNLSSDTQTRPSAAMKAAMLAAEVGDEQAGSDPTIWALCDRVAALLGKEAAVFLPSGTMCNQIALAVHCRPGDEVLAHATAHVQGSEAGGPGAIAGVMVTGLPGPRGMFAAATLEAAIRPGRYSPPQRLVVVEQTSNRGGGSCWPVAQLQDVAACAHAHGLATHMDGARLLNAAVALGVSAAEQARGFDSAWVDFTKGLGAPLGAVLAGSKAFIGQAWRWKQRLGGALRQGGICAAACLYALDHNVARLAEDHANAKTLARGMAALPGVAVEEEPETNLIFFDTSDTGLTAAEFAGRLRQQGVLISTAAEYRGRACLHLDVGRARLEEALAAMRLVISSPG